MKSTFLLALFSLLLAACAPTATAQPTITAAPTSGGKAIVLLITRVPKATATVTPTPSITPIVTPTATEVPATPEPTATAQPWRSPSSAPDEASECHLQNEREWVYAHFNENRPCYVPVAGPLWPRRVVIYRETETGYERQETFNLPSGWLEFKEVDYTIEKGGFTVELLEVDGKLYMKVSTQKSKKEYVLMQDTQVDWGKIADFQDFMSK